MRRSARCNRDDLLDEIAENIRDSVDRGIRCDQPFAYVGVFDGFQHTHATRYIHNARRDGGIEQADGRIGGQTVRGRGEVETGRCKR